jgi:serine/threonine protein kinase
MTEPSQQTISGRYLVERALGQQPVGRYVAAVDTLAGGRVTLFLPALEGVRPQRFVEQMSVEVRRLQPLEETAYCTVRDVGLTAGGEPFVVVPRPQGTSLQTILRQEGRLSPDRAVSIALQICDLVRRAHVLGLVPGCLDLDSVIVDAQPGGRARVSIVDLGLYRGAYGAGMSVPCRQTLFDAPQVRGNEVADPRDDVFSVTAILHALILGVAPPAMSAFGPADGSGWAALPDETLDRRLEACLHTVLLRGLAPDRDERFPHIGALQRALTGLRQLMSLTAPAFELLAATRSRLGQGPDALDLRIARPAYDRAAEARARIREVAAAGATGGANLSSMHATGGSPRRETGSVETGDFQPAHRPTVAHSGDSVVGPVRPNVVGRVPLAQRSAREP